METIEKNLIINQDKKTNFVIGKNDVAENNQPPQSSKLINYKRPNSRPI
jgi:hypothetical protein